MEITRVGSTTLTSALASFDVTLPTCLEGDVIVVALGTSYSSDVNLGVSTSGYTEEADIYHNCATSYDANLAVFSKRMGSTPDTTVTCTSGSGGGRSTGALVQVFRGVHPTTLLDVALVSATGTGVDASQHIYVDPPSITPTTAGAKILIFGLGTENDSYGTPAAPSGYAEQLFINATPGYDYALLSATKTWSSGTEDPAYWDVHIASTQERSWAAITIALRPDPAVEVSPAPATLTITGELAGFGYEFTPAAATLTLTGSPVTYEMIMADLFSTFPPLTALIERIGSGAELAVDLTPLNFYGETNIPSNLAVVLPEIPFTATTGGAFALETEALFSEFTGTSGSISTFDATLPVLAFTSQAAAKLESTLTIPGFLFTADVTMVGRLSTELPAFAALFSGYTESDAALYQTSLVVNLPLLRPALEAHVDLYGGLVADLGPLSTLFTVSTGSVATLQAELETLEALLTAYSTATGELVTILPALQNLFSAYASGRFDTATETQLDLTILKWRRPQ